jgi:iron complex transport system permease protein
MSPHAPLSRQASESSAAERSAASSPPGAPPPDGGTPRTAAIARERITRERIAWIVLGIALPIVLILSVCIGSTPVPIADFLRALVGHGDPLLRVVVWEVRVPRTVLAALIGGTLGLAGAAMQGLLRNPLADPGVLGVSTGASLGAVVAIYSGLGGAFAYGVPLGGMIGAGCASLCLHLLTGRESTTETLILAGVAVNAVAAALTSLVLNFAPNPSAALEIVFWLMGSLTDRSWVHIGLVFPFMLAGSLLLLAATPALRALSLGEETAFSLGVNPARARALVVIGASLAVGAGVAVCGAVGFVGLVVPHVMRPWVREDPGRLLPISAVAGAVLLPIADIGVRLMRTGPELKLGVLTALAGAPFFLILVFRMRRGRV